MDMAPADLVSSFRRATAADVEAIVAFRAREGWDDTAYVRWRFGLDRNQLDCPGELWVLWQGGTLRGMIGRERQPFVGSGLALDAQVLIDLQIDPALEGAGGGTWLNQAMFAKAAVTVALGANPRSIGLVKRLFVPMPPRRYHVLPLDFARLLLRHGVPAPMSRWLGSGMSAGWRLRSRWPSGRSQGVEVDEASSIQDSVLREVHGARDAAIVGLAPTARDLAWRLHDNPRARYSLLVLRRQGRAIGYAAARVTRETGERAGLHLIHWQCALDDETAAFHGLMRHCIAWALRERCDRIFTTVLDASAEPLLRRMGFLRAAPSPYHLNGLYVASESESEALVSRQWRLTDLSFDNDGCY